MGTPASATSIAIIGPGAIGATLATRLTLNPSHRVIVAARTAFDRIVLDTADGTFVASPAVVTDPAAATAVDWVLVTTKAYDAPSAAAWLPALTGTGTRVAILQNGVEHVERFAPWTDRDRLVPVMIDLPADRTAPGRVIQRGPGRLTAPDSPAGRDFVRLFAGTGVSAGTTPDMTTELWRKLCLNSVGAVSAVTLVPGRIASHDGVADLMRGIVRECIAVGRAEGAVLDDDLADRVVDGYRSGPGDGINSLHADRLAERPMETDARNGAIVRIGARHGIPTPLNAMMVNLLEGIERYGRPTP